MYSQQSLPPPSASAQGGYPAQGGPVMMGVSPTAGASNPGNNPNDSSANAAIERWKAYLEDLQEKDSKACQYIETAKAAIARGDVQQKPILDKWLNYRAEIQSSIRSAEETIAKIRHSQPSLPSPTRPQLSYAMSSMSRGPMSNPPSVPAVAVAPQHTVQPPPPSSSASSVSSSQSSSSSVPPQSSSGAVVGSPVTSVVLPQMGQMMNPNVQIPQNMNPMSNMNNMSNMSNMSNELPFKRQRIDQGPVMGPVVSVPMSSVSMSMPPSGAPQASSMGLPPPPAQQQQQQQQQQQSLPPPPPQQQQPQSVVQTMPGVGRGGNGNPGQLPNLVFEVRKLAEHLDAVGPRIQNERNVIIPNPDIFGVNIKINAFYICIPFFSNPFYCPKK